MWRLLPLNLVSKKVYLNPIYHPLVYLQLVWLLVEKNLLDKMKIILTLSLVILAASFASGYSLMRDARITPTDKEVKDCDAAAKHVASKHGGKKWVINECSITYKKDEKVETWELKMVIPDGKKGPLFCKDIEVTKGIIGLSIKKDTCKAKTEYDREEPHPTYTCYIRTGPESIDTCRSTYRPISSSTGSGRTM